MLLLTSNTAAASNTWSRLSSSMSGEHGQGAIARTIQARSDALQGARRQIYKPQPIDESIWLITCNSGSDQVVQKVWLTDVLEIVLTTTWVWHVLSYEFLEPNRHSRFSCLLSHSMCP